MGRTYTCIACPSGYQCPSKDKYPIKCEAGKYSKSANQTCSECDPGYVCNEGSTSATPAVGLCPYGYYSADKISKTDCPAGTYGNKTGAVSETDGCAPCPAGYYCEPATAGYPTHTLKCPKGHYCPISTKTNFEYPCPDGKFNNQLGLERPEQCKHCLPGRYCSGGDPTGDTLCPKGHYCLAGTTSAKQYPCLDGFYTNKEGAESKCFFKTLQSC